MEKVKLLRYIFIVIKSFFIKLINLRERKKFHLLKDKYKNNRCFIIGNGPSLRCEDLQKLTDEFCFGSHKIYDIFSKTVWRPNFYVAQDFKFIDIEINSIIEKTKDVEYRFLPSNIWFKYPSSIRKTKNTMFFNFNIEPFFPNLPKFSDKVEDQIFEGMTVTYACIQLAVYMGFKEIYLLGVDHNYSVVKDSAGNLIRSNSTDYFEGSENLDISKFNVPQTEKSTLAYLSAKQYCEKNNILICNLTRGGKLDVFKRDKFENVVKNRGEK